MVIKILLVLLGILCSFKGRNNIIYISYFILPFTDMGGIRFINISFFDLFRYMCFIPMLIVFAIDILEKRKSTNREFIYISIALIYLFSYILTRYVISIHPDKSNLITIIAAGFILFLYILYNSKYIDMDKIQLITMIIIGIEVYLAINQALGKTTSEIVPFVYSTIGENDYIELSNFYRAIGSQGDPNHYAMLLGILTASLINQLNKIHVKIFFTMGLIGLLFGFSRMGIVIFFILITICIVKYFKNSKKSYLTMSLLFFSIPIIVLFVMAIVTNSQSQIFIANIIQRFQEDSFRGAMAAGSRRWIIHNYFNNILNIKNFIFGLGLQNFEYELFKMTGIHLVAHNQYIQMLADIGILGYIPILIIIIIINKKDLKSNKVNPFWISIMILLISNLFLITTYLLYIYSFLGLYVACKIKNSQYEEIKEVSSN
ncbi:O-antigen ligase family protein [Wukongibacter sp. M2B1]|uniref:O-antigen ligase family protein n=1 Tax=Wukongibacter sp. M2B1 TaxID=3088895 RepID=UPI003D7B2715